MLQRVINGVIHWEHNDAQIGVHSVIFLLHTTHQQDKTKIKMNNILNYICSFMQIKKK